MTSSDIIEQLINVTHPHAPEATRQAQREALHALLRLRCAEYVLAVTLDQLQVQQAMTDD